MDVLDQKTLAVAIAAAGTGLALGLPIGAAVTAPAVAAQASAALALLAGAGILLVRRPAPRRDAEPSTLRPPAGAYPSSAEAPALAPEAWLGRLGSVSLDRKERETAIDAALRAQFDPKGGDRATRMLLAGLEAFPATAGFLRDLAAAMRLPPEQRSKAIDALEARAPLPFPGKDLHFSFETNLLAAYEAARDRAGITCASFSWLRFHRREAWFAINSLGRPKPFVEGLMPLLHYRCEREAGRALRDVDTTPAREALARLADDIEAGRAA